MKEMVYQKEPKREILFQGEYNGLKFAILSLGTHPVAYVECKIKTITSYRDPRLEELEVHGGFTYFGRGYWNEKDFSLYLGWDYMHFLDYKGYFTENDPLNLCTQKWTTAEIYEEVKSVIEQLSQLKKKRG